MVNMLRMMQQLRQVKKLQKDLEGRLYEAKSPDGLVAVVARGDMTVKSIRLDPGAAAPGQAESLGRTIASTVNSALETAKRAAAADMGKLAGDLGQFAGLMDG
jgi:DNA-binding protein YbaB